MSTVMGAAAQGWFESMRLAWGAWLSSPGAGILGAIVAALVAYVGIGRKAMTDRQNAEQAARDDAEKDRVADARQRWWEAYNHLWANRDVLPPASLAKGVQSLSDMRTTEQQEAMAAVFLEYLVTRPTRGRR